MTLLDELLSTPQPEHAGQLFAPDIAKAPSDWKDSNSWTFEAFAMHLHEENCRSCGATHRHSNVYRMFVRRYPAATDRRLIVANVVPDSLSVIVYKMPIKEVPICLFCLTADREGSQRILVSSENEWNEAQRRDREARSASRPRTAATVVHKPLSELL